MLPETHELLTYKIKNLYKLLDSNFESLEICYILVKNERYRTAFKVMEEVLFLVKKDDTCRTLAQDILDILKEHTKCPTNLNQ